MPTLQNNPFAQFQPPPTSSNPFQPTAPQQHPQQLYGSPGTGSGFFGAQLRRAREGVDLVVGQPGTQSQAFQPKSVQSSSGFGAQANPFGSSSGANPFASAPAPSSNPFGGPASNDPFAFGGGQLVPYVACLVLFSTHLEKHAATERVWDSTQPLRGALDLRLESSGPPLLAGRCVLLITPLALSVRPTAAEWRLWKPAEWWLRKPAGQPV